jgi:hypothetical protein
MLNEQRFTTLSRIHSSKDETRRQTLDLPYYSLERLEFTEGTSTVPEIVIKSGEDLLEGDGGHSRNVRPSPSGGHLRGHSF